MNRLLFYILPLFVIFSCSKEKQKNEDESPRNEKDEIKVQKIIPESIPSSEYESYVYSIENNLKERKINDFEFRAQLIAPEEQVFKELKGEEITKRKFDSLMQQYRGMHYVNFSIDRNDFNEELLKYNIEDLAQYQERISYYAFDFQKDIKMEVCGQIYDCKLYHFERNFGMKSELNFSLGFEVPKGNCKDNQIKLVVDDKIYNAGRVKFNFSYQPFPEIKFNS